MSPSVLFLPFLIFYLDGQPKDVEVTDKLFDTKEQCLSVVSIESQKLNAENVANRFVLGGCLPVPVPNSDPRS